MAALPSISPSPQRQWTRVLLAGPGAILVTLVLLAGTPLWLPGGAAGIDNLALPLVLAPLIWALLFFHACLDRNLARVALIAGTLLLIHGGMVAARFMGSAPVVEKAL
ncbi:hypothetical protein LQ953_09685 [Sphingomonas sp. IC-56]|nr:hypothetical protein [Sphingomonas sp. IC-56]